MSYNPENKQDCYQQIKIALFSSKSYDPEYFTRAARGFNHEITHFEEGKALSKQVVYAEVK